MPKQCNVGTTQVEINVSVKLSNCFSLSKCVKLHKK